VYEKLPKDHNEKGKTLLAALKPKKMIQGGCSLLAVHAIRKRNIP
jgi:hypothetical protein